MKNLFFELSDVYFDKLSGEHKDIAESKLLGDICFNRVEKNAKKKH